jgi:segregation and condensation protein B
MQPRRLPNSVQGTRDSGDESPLSLGLDGFLEFGDQGAALDELGQAYAALLAKGADPYPQSGTAKADQPADSDLPELADSPAAEQSANDAHFAVTPRGILEAILFVGHPTGEPLTSERIAALMRGVRPAEIDDLIGELNAEYDAVGAPYSILSIGPGYQLALRPQFGSLRDAFQGRIREARLSQAAVDVLAIVSYNQPIAADEIDRLRGKTSNTILMQLVRRDLLALHRTPDKKAKPQYQTTDRFLQLFGLDDLRELPRSQDIDRD